MYGFNLLGSNVRLNVDNSNTPEGYSLETQVVDDMTNQSLTVREFMYNEMTREKTQAELQNIRQMYADSLRAQEAEQLDFWDRAGAGWETASIQESISADANEIRSIRAKGGDKDLEDALMDRIARNRWKLSQIVTPEDTGMWSAFNIGSGIRSMAPGFLAEIPFMAGEIALGAALSMGTGGASITAATLAAGRRLVKLRRMAKATYAAGKAMTMWEAFSRREEGSMYADIMDRTDLTETQKAAMAVSYGRLAGAVELLGWNLGAGGLAMRGVKAVSNKFISPVEKWTADAIFKNTIKQQVKQAAEKTAKGRMVNLAKGTVRAGFATGAEVMEEGTQRALETTSIKQGLAGETPDALSVAKGGFSLLAGVPVELVKGKLSEESIAILEAMGSAILPSAIVGGGGLLLSSTSRAMADISPADTGRTSTFTIKNNSLKSSILSAEKSLGRLTAITNYMGDQDQSTDHKLQIIDGLVRNAELEGAVHFAPEDTEVLLALGEAKPSLKNTMAKLGITKAISEGKKTGTVSMPMRAFAELASQKEVRESGVDKQLNISGTLSLSDSSYSRIERNIKAGAKKGKELLAKPSPKFEQKLKGLRRQFKAAGYTDVEIEANLTELAKGVATLVEASNGALTPDEAIEEFEFKIEKRDFDLNMPGLKKKTKPGDAGVNKNAVSNIVSKFIGDTRETLGFFRRVKEGDRKPIPDAVAKLNVESVAAEMARIDANEKEYAGETIKINGVERSVYNSHGVRIAKSAKALRAFYKWFGNSKCVDELGRPKVLYHGTPAAGFLAFDKAFIGDIVHPWTKTGFFFTDDISVAASYADTTKIITRDEAEKASAGDVDPSAGIYQVYLKMESPINYDARGARWDGVTKDVTIFLEEENDYVRDSNGDIMLFDTPKEAYDYYGKTPGLHGGKISRLSKAFMSTDEVAEMAEDIKADGAIISNVVDFGDGGYTDSASTTYVVFEPEQIKSTDNYGMFDPNAVDMYRSITRTVYAGSPVDYGFPMLKAIGTGEGHYAHGWGLYYALEFDVAERYRKRYFDIDLDVLWGEYGIDEEIKNSYGNGWSDFYISIRRNISRNKKVAMFNSEIRKLVSDIEKNANDLYQARMRRKQYAAAGFDVSSESQEIKDLRKKRDELRFKAKKISEEGLDNDETKSIIESIKDGILSDIKYVVGSLEEGLARQEKEIKDLKSGIANYDKQIKDMKSNKAKFISEELDNMQKNPPVYSLGMIKDAGAKDYEEYLQILAEERFDAEINFIEGKKEYNKDRIEFLQKSNNYTKKRIKLNKSFVEKLNSGVIEKKLKFKADIITGQTKEFTVRKIDTFMRENKPLSLQSGAVKNAIRKMMSQEKEIAKKLIVTSFDDYWAELDADEQKIFEESITAKADKELRKNIDEEYLEQAVTAIYLDFFVFSMNGEEIRKSINERIQEYPENTSIRREYEARLKALEILEPYVLDAMNQVSDITTNSDYDGGKLYDGLVNIFLGKEPDDFGGDYTKKEVHEAKKEASMLLHKYGINGISYYGQADHECLVVFDSSIVKAKESFLSRRKDAPQDKPESEFELFSEEVGVRGPKELFVSSHADLTTFAHEVMHFVTRGLIEMYNDGSISETWKRQIDSLYDYFSTMPSKHGPAAMHKVGNKIIMETEASETLSGGFQQYIEWGKASDPALKKLYAFIKDLAADLWKVLNRGYYKSQALSDKQIAFYDQVMSAHTDIKDTEYRYGYAPLEKPEGVSDEEYEEYTIERKVARAKSSNSLFRAQRQLVKNRKRAEWIKLFDEEFPKAEAELSAQPEYRVISYIKDNGGLNKDSFAAGTSLWTSVPQKYFSKKQGEGITIEQLNGKFGPEISIADIAKILAEVPSLYVAARRRARTEADRRFLEEFDPAADITPANAMRNILFIRSLVKESLMIKGEPLSSFPAHYAIWIKEAENCFMGLTVKNAKDLEKWADMESRVTDDFMAAFTGGDTDTAALKADQRAMVNYVLVRSKQLRKDEARFKRRFRKFYSAPQTKDIKTMDGVTWNLIHTILQEYGFTRRKGRLSASAKEQFTAWCEARKGRQYFPYETMVNEINLLSSIPKSTSLTVERFNRMYALVEQIRAIGEAEKKVFDGEKRAELDVVAGEIIDNVMKMRATKGDDAFLAYRKGSWARLTVPQMGMLEPLFGPLGMRKLYVALRNALVARDDLAENTRAFIADSFEKNNIGALLADKREFMVGNRSVNNNILLFALQHSGNDHNRDNAIVTLQQYFKDPSFSEAEYEDLLNATPTGMRNYVNDLWTMFKNLKTMIDEQSRVATGELIATVEAVPYTLRDGTKMSGGYFPAKKINKISITDPLDTYYDNNFLFPRAGLLKDRIKNATGGLDLSQDALSRWIFQAVNLATTQVAFNDIATIFKDESVISAFGPNAGLVTQYVNDWLQAAVLPVSPQPKALRALAKGPTVIFLGFKAVSGLVQLLGTLVGLNEVSMPSLLASSGKLLNVGKYFKISEEMSKRSAFMADRARKFDSRFFGLMKDENMLEKATRKYGDGIVSASMSFVRTFQCMADMVVWDGAYSDGKKAGMSDKEASDHADYVVMKTQGDRVQMNTPDGFQGVLRFFQPFMTYVLTLNQMGSAAYRSRNFKKLGALVALIVLSNALEAYFKESDKEWRRKLLGKKTKGTDADFWKRYRNRFLVQTVSTLGDVAIPFAGLGGTLSLALTEDMLKSVSPGYRAYTGGATPAVEVATTAAKAIRLDKDTWKSIYDEDMSLGANLIDFAL